MPVPLSALEHYAYCPRQAGLILLEDGYADDASTTRGTIEHQRVHEPGVDQRGALRTLRALPVWSDPLGLVGVCDIVELHASGDVVPVEYKSGPFVVDGPANVQLAGQAMCLEERFDCRIATGVIYSGADRRRHPVPITAELRNRVRDTADRVRSVMTRSALPPAVADARCRRCSMNTACMPRLLADQRAYDTAATELFTPASAGEWND